MEVPSSRREQKRVETRARIVRCAARAFAEVPPQVTPGVFITYVTLAAWAAPTRNRVLTSTRNIFFHIALPP